MSKIYHNETCPFNFDDWQTKNIRNIFAGNSCIMAITDSSEVLQKVADEKLAENTQYWRNIKTISISQCFPALAVGLTDYGTCIISSNALMDCCKITGQSFNYIDSEIRSLKNIVEIAVSDAIFALDSFGYVHHIPIWNKDAYKAVDNWRNISHIAVGNQDAVFGITDCGKVVCAGGNFKTGLFGNTPQLSEFENVTDICAMGAESNELILALANGKIVNSYGNDMNIEHCGQFPVFHNNYLFTAIRLKNHKIKCHSYMYCDRKDVLEKIETSEILDISTGVDTSYSFFVVWLEK